jgi:acyl-CoA dehydrogenase
VTLLYGLIAALAIGWILAYFRAPLLAWTVAAAAAIPVSGYFAPPTQAQLITTWVIFALIFVPLNVPAIRRLVITRRIFPSFRKVVPPMSQTEREALEAGSVWWDGELFSGNPDWKKLLSTPAPELSPEEQAFLAGPVQELCDMLDDWRITDGQHDLSAETWQFLKDNGFFGMIIPKEYGGLGFSALAHSAVVMKIAGRSITAAVTVMVPNSLGPAELLLRYGTPEQKNHYLKRLAHGKDIPCFGLTGPDAGSDASSIPDRGVVCKELYKGKETLGIRLTWEKRYITLGPVATVLGLAFRLYDPQHLLTPKEDIGITLALIPTDHPGVNIGSRHYPLNMVFQNGPNSGKDVFIPIDWVIGGQERVGQGWRMLMECLAAGRSISLPSLSTGAGKLVCRATGAYSRIRKQFKTPIGRFEGVEEPLARMAGYTYMMDAARIMTAGAVDIGEEPAVASAIVKYNLTERMRAVVNDAMDVQGGSGICMGPRNFLARIYQAIPISITVEGANILTRTLIIFGQGAVRCHPYVFKEIQAAKDEDPKRGLVAFDKAIFGHVGFIISNIARSLFLALTGGRLAYVPETTPARYYFQQVTRMSAAFALVADAAMLALGGSLKRREKLSGRLADVLSQLYLVSAAAKRFVDEGDRREDLPLLQWSCQDALYQAQEALVALLRNFPIRPIAWGLHALVFPLGKPYKQPDDALGQQVAARLLEPSESRDRLTAGMYLSSNTSEPLGRLEDALEKIIAAEAVERKIRQAVKAGTLDKADEQTLLRMAEKRAVISKDEADVVKAAEAARREVIMVDDFPADYWKRKEN